MPKLGFIYTRHVLDRMSQRGITKKRVEEAIAKAQTFEPLLEGKRKATYKRKGKKSLIIIYTPKGKKLAIISTYYDN